MSPVYKLKHSLHKQNQLLKEARDLLLPRLMTGLIDVDSLALPELLPENAINSQKAAEKSELSFEQALDTTLGKNHALSQHLA